jgi:phosphate transport system protein
MLSGDSRKAKQVIKRDREIDRLELELDKATHELLALQQPMAGDLRIITMTMKISNDLERVGDHAVGIAKAVRREADLLALGPTPEVVEMARLARQMLAQALDSFVRADPGLARHVCQSDDQVDRLYNSVFQILVRHMSEDPRWIGPAMAILLISRNLERIADYATNIATRSLFLSDRLIGRPTNPVSHPEDRSWKGFPIVLG